jgi:hypothetical protein
MKPHIRKTMVHTMFGSKRLWVCAGVGDKSFVYGYGHNPLSAYDDWLIRSLKA